MIFHIDANSFYASCERLFRPDLEGRPIVVLSNNDGIIIALNAEAKGAGLKRGDAYFKVAERCDRSGTVVFSSNYTLYADISGRIVDIYNRLCPEVEVYSIDECFLYFPDWDEVSLIETARLIRDTVAREVGMPVSVGIAATKTLAKLCNKLAKKTAGIFSGASRNIDAEMAATPVADVWGIGNSRAAVLTRRAVHTALDLKHYPLLAAKQDLTIAGFRTVQELNGIPALSRQERDRHQNICSSKSFAEAVYTLADLEEALTSYTHEAVARMREQFGAARYISVYLMTNPWNLDDTQRCVHLTAKLDHATAWLPDILSTALGLLRRLYSPGYRYRKVMIHLLEIDDEADCQGDLFSEPKDRQNDSEHKALMTCLDTINGRWGRGTLGIGSAALKRSSPTIAAAKNPHAIGGALIAGTPHPVPSTLGTTAPRWAMRRQFLSPAYTTDPAALPRVR